MFSATIADHTVHMKQHRGLPIKRSDDKVTLEGPSQPRWKNPPQRIEVPSNDMDTQRCKNPFNGRMSNNLYSERGPSSSIPQPLPLPSGSSRSNPNTMTVVASRHFSSGNNTFKDNDKKKIDLRSERPAKRRKTDTGSGSFSSSIPGRTHLTNGQSRKSEAFMQTRSPVIDLVDEEDVGESISSKLPPTITISSPLTPTVSSDDIGLRSKHPRARSPSVSEFADDVSRPNSPVHSTGTNEWTDQNVSYSIGSKGKEKSLHIHAPHTQLLMERYQEDPIDNTDDFDNLSLGDVTSNRPRGNGISTLVKKADIPRGFVRSTVENIEARTGSNEPPHVDLEKIRIVDRMKAKIKNSEELRRSLVEGPSTVPKPPSKPDRETSTTKFVKKSLVKAKTISAPLVEYVYNGQTSTTTGENPFSVCFTENDISIFNKERVVHQFSNLSVKRVQRPSEPLEFKSACMVVFWLPSGQIKSNTGDDGIGLGLKLQPLVHNRLRTVWEFILKIGKGCNQELVNKGALPGIWQTLLNPTNSLNSSPISINSPMKRAKPRSIPIQRPSTRLSSRGGSTPSNDANRSRRSPSPSHEELILVYPPSGTGALNITYGDLRRLEPGEFLNDTLIEFGLKLWLNDFRNRESELADQVHVFSSFFYTQLHQKNLEEGYQNVRKWTSRVDIFKKKYIIVPINENLHWYLAIICHAGRILQNEERKATSPTDVDRLPPSDPHSTAPENKEAEILMDASTANDESTHVEPSSNSTLVSPTLSRGGSPPARSITRSVSPPDPIDIISDLPDSMDVDEPVVDITAEPTLSDIPHIFTFDSLGSRHPHVLKTLNSYLRMEAKDKKDFTVSINAHTAQALVPTQPNSCDCGVYLLHFVEQFMSDPERFIKHILISKSKTPKKSWPTVKSEREQLWNAAEVAGKRQALKEKVVTLSAEWKQIRRPDDKGKGKEETQPSGPSKERDEDSDIEVLEVTAAPSTSKPGKQKVQRLR